MASPLKTLALTIFFFICLCRQGQQNKSDQMRRHQTAVLLHSETESQPTEWERIVVNDIPDKELISNI